MKHKPAKACYDHVGGKLGHLLYAMFVDKKWIKKKNAANKYYYITTIGKKEFEKLGIDLSEIEDIDI